MNTCLAPLPPAAAMIPVLDGIPGEFSLRPESAFWANISLWCDEAGIVKAQDWKAAKDAQDIATSALHRWSAGFGELKHLGCAFHFDKLEADSYLGSELSYEDLLSARNLDSNRQYLTVSASPNKFNERVIGPRILALEAACPGLGETALSALRDSAYRTVNVLDPALAFNTATYTFWYGESDENMALEEIAAMGEDPEAYDLVRLKDFTDYAPKWVWTPGTKITPQRLAAITKDAALPNNVRQVASISRNILRHLKNKPFPDQWAGIYDESLIGIGMALWWGQEPACIMQRVWDDFMNQTMQSGEGIEAFGFDIIEATPDGFCAWMDQKQRWIELAVMQDTLIDLISEDIEGHE